MYQCFHTIQIQDVPGYLIDFFSHPKYLNIQLH